MPGKPEASACARARPTRRRGRRAGCTTRNCATSACARLSFVSGTAAEYRGRKRLAKKGGHAMGTDTALTAPTRFIETGGIRFAYRRWGKPGGLPLVFLNYFSGNLDDWDPLVTDGFAADHDVILFDNAGVASSGGETPGTVSEMTRHAVAFCDALGFSLGGMIAQQLAMDHPDHVVCSGV